MKLWALVPVAAVLTAVVFLPEFPAMEAAMAPEAKLEPMTRLAIAKSAPSFGLPSRSPVSAYATSQKPLAGVKICVDPGHGGQTMWSKVSYTGGTQGVVTGQTESDVNLRVALLLKQYLEEAGAQIFMTRVSDDRVSGDSGKTGELDQRSRIANSKNSDLFISIHHNEGYNRSANYTVVFYPGGMPRASVLAENIASAVSRYLGTQNVGAKTGSSYRVLKGVKMPGVIVESSFMSCPQEDLRLQSLAYNKMQAKAIATGILNYVRVSRQQLVDFNTIFSPIDSKADSAQAIADATLVRKQIIEKKSLFGVCYEEVTTGNNGQVISRRSLGGDSLTNKRSIAARNRSKNSKSAKIADAAPSRNSKTGKKSIKVADASSKSSSKKGASVKKTKKVSLN
ncbi:MAG: N-acetylmuramoyl-L-alanine amidase [bacterium]